MLTVNIMSDERDVMVRLLHQVADRISEQEPGLPLSLNIWDINHKKLIGSVTLSTSKETL